MAAPAVPRSWVWHTRLRDAARQSAIALAPVALATLGSRSAGAMEAAFGIGVVLVLLLALRGPSPTEAAVATALRTGELPAGLSLALVDTEASARLRGRGWARFAWVFGVASIALGVVLLVVRGATTDRVAHWAVLTVVSVTWSWELTASAREAVRWRSGADERWSAWAAAVRASAG